MQVLVATQLVHYPIMKCEVYGKPDGHSDDDRLQDVELPAEDNQDTDGDQDDGEHGEDGQDAQDDVPGGDEQDQEADCHSHRDGHVGSLKQVFLQVIKFCISNREKFFQTFCHAWQKLNKGIFKSFK